MRAVVRAPAIPFVAQIVIGLFDAEQRNPELLVAVEGSRTAWKRPLAAIFDLPGASTDWGWNFDRLDRVGLFVGSPGWKPARHGKIYTVRLARTMTAGFRIADGAVVWRDRGSTFWCTYLPCPDAAEASYSSPGAGGTETLGVRIRSTGSLSGTMTSRVPHLSRDARASIEGFDPRTGRTRWRFAAGRNVALISHQLQPTRLDADTIAIRDAGGKLVALDLRSGSRRPLQPDAHGWCRAEVLYRQSYRYPGTPVGTPSLYAGQPSLFPCTARQRRLPTPRRAARFVGEIGAAAHGLVAWADKTAVHAVPGG